MIRKRTSTRVIVPTENTEEEQKIVVDYKPLVNVR